MTAASTQGVGQGASFGKSKNTYEQTLNTEKLVGPHFAATGRVQLTATTAVITFPYPLAKPASAYNVLLGTNSAVASTTGKTDSSSQFAYFTINGTSANIVEWTIVDTGNAS